MNRHRQQSRGYAYNNALELHALREAAKTSVTALEERRRAAGTFVDAERIARVDLLKMDVSWRRGASQRLECYSEASEWTGARSRIVSGYM